VSEQPMTKPKAGEPPTDEEIDAFRESVWKSVGKGDVEMTWREVATLSNTRMYERALIRRVWREAEEATHDWWRSALEKWATVEAGEQHVAAIVKYSGRYGGTPSMIVQAIVRECRERTLEEAAAVAAAYDRDWTGPDGTSIDPPLSIVTEEIAATITNLLDIRTR